MAQSRTLRAEAGVAEAERLLAAARQTMAKVRDCWVATPAADGGVNLRVVEPLPAAPGEAEWTICFATSRRSRKAGEIERAGRLTLAYQHHPDRSYVALFGRAAIVAERRLVDAYWRDAMRRFFPGGPEDPDFILVRLVVDRIELCVPGITPEPFGIRYAAVVREASGAWRVLS